jgi:plasmid stabilization system protein ParE
MKLTISPTARLQLAELKAWWDANRPAARVRVEDAFAEAVEVLTEYPRLGPVYAKARQYRTTPLKGTPYYLVYRIDEAADAILIAAVWSSKRGQGPPLG